MDAKNIILVANPWSIAYNTATRDLFPVGREAIPKFLTALNAWCRLTWEASSSYPQSTFFELLPTRRISAEQILYWVCGSIRKEWLQGSFSHWPDVAMHRAFAGSCERCQVVSSDLLQGVFIQKLVNPFYSTWTRPIQLLLESWARGSYAKSTSPSAVRLTSSFASNVTKASKGGSTLWNTHRLIPSYQWNKQGLKYKQSCKDAISVTTANFVK